jgi:uncharacterized protein (TIGR02145 family)
MKSKSLFTLTFAFLTLMALGQRSAIELTFSAVNINAHVQLDSVKIMNRTEGGDTVLYYPDTVLVLDFTGIPEPQKITSDFRVFQNYPNPITDQTTISLYVPEKDQVSIIITDLLGRESLKTEKVLDKGNHSFQFHPGSSGLYFFTAQWKGRSSSIKIIRAASNLNNSFGLEYIGGQVPALPLKTSEDILDFAFSEGDELLYIGYADTLQSGMLDMPETSEKYTFQFATNIPCPGTSTVIYEGQIYNTIQIFSQCWFKENLNVGTMIVGGHQMASGPLIEKYCYNNKQDSCTKYGGLYQWDEMMQYSTQDGAQGICPSGWHLPTDEEWKVLEGAVDSQYGIGDPEWYGFSTLPRGFDVGLNLKSATTWFLDGHGTDKFGFSGLPGGVCGDGPFYNIGKYAEWWASDYRTGLYFLIFHYLSYDIPEITRTEEAKIVGFSARCVRDVIYVAPFELTITAINNDSYVKLDSIKVMNRSQGFEKTISWPDTTLVLPDELNFVPGNELLIIGYSESAQSGILVKPLDNQIYTLQFASNIPCPGMPVVTYEGQVYNTIQIFSQCWMKENLNVGIRIDSTQNMGDNGIIEKYCYRNLEDNCTGYGGLYQWKEMMQYIFNERAQGICPDGWHIPDAEDWKVLEGGVDSQFRIGDTIWDIEKDTIGFDAGLKLKSTSGWYSGGDGTDLYGFTAKPAGYRDFQGKHFSDLTYGAYFWTSSWRTSVLKWRRSLSYGTQKINHQEEEFVNGFSVRCLRDE